MGARKAGEWRYEHFGHDGPLSALVLVGDVLCTASTDGTLRATRCSPPAAVGSGGEDAGLGTATGSLPEDILRGVDNAAAELGQRASF